MKNKNKLMAGVVAALVTTASILLVKRIKKSQEGKPPKKAPQLPSTNPGEQSEFTTAASDSELG